MSAPTWHDPVQLQAARQRLSSKGLLQAGDSLSLRLPGAAACLFALESADVGHSAFVRLAFDAPAASTAAEQHRLIYLARADVGAVLLSRQRWAVALPAAGGTLPGVFDEQLRHLGAQVSQIPTPQTLEQTRMSLAGGANAFGLGAQVLCLGMTLERLVFNAELLEKCAQAYLLARAGGLSVRRIPWLVRLIATGRLRRDQRRAAASYARGEAPARVAGY
jgi:ribulose-5-phosphate 4-epimerase/fuculose-1-phosphate aldolase